MSGDGLPITAEVKISADDIVRGVNRETLKAFVLDIDSRVAEVDFTADLVKGLLFSLKTDMSPREMQELFGPFLK